MEYNDNYYTITYYLDYNLNLNLSHKYYKVYIKILH